MEWKSLPFFFLWVAGGGGEGRGFFFQVVFGVESGVSTVQPLTYFGFYHGTNVGACSPTLLHYMTKLEMRGRGGGEK